LRISPDVAAGTKSLCQREGVTLFTALLTVFKVLLRHYCSHDDLVVGTNVANRNRLEVEGLIGFFVNQLVLRTDLGGNPSFRELLGRVREVVLAAYVHEDLPFEMLVTELMPQRRASHSPLYQVLFTLQLPRREPRIPAGLDLSEVPVPATTARFDLVLKMVDTGQGLLASFEYDSDLFSDLMIARMLTQYESLLRTALGRPDIRLDELRKTLEEAEKIARCATADEFKKADVEQLAALKRGKGRRDSFLSGS